MTITCSTENISKPTVQCNAFNLHYVHHDWWVNHLRDIHQIKHSLKHLWFWKTVSWSIMLKCVTQTNVQMDLIMCFKQIRIRTVCDLCFVVVYVVQLGLAGRILLSLKAWTNGQIWSLWDKQRPCSIMWTYTSHWTWEWCIDTALMFILHP